jgi:L-iditol 2-dehydrogenase
MWAYRAEGPMRLVRHETVRPRESELAVGGVVVRFRAGGICGSDIPYCRDVGTGPDPEPLGWSLHEMVGEVVASRSDLDVGQRVVGWATDSRGLCEYVRNSAEELLAIDVDLDDVHAVALQPLACVLHALCRLPPVAGLRTAVLGLGPIGLLFGHALKDAGAASVVGVDPIDRRDIAAGYGLDRVECLSSRAWSHRSDAADGFDLVIEAVGHQVGTLEDAITVAAPEATIVYYGNPDDDYYPIRLGAMMDKRLTLQAGRTPIAGRRVALRRAVDYVARHPDLFASYVTDVLPVDQAPQAYEIASRPAPGRLKVVIDGGSGARRVR